MSSTVLWPSKLQGFAADIAVPVLPDGTRARAYVTLETHGPDHRSTEPCRHLDRWRVVFGLDYGRHDSEPMGPAFPRPEDAGVFARLLNGQRLLDAADARVPAQDPEGAPEGVTEPIPDHGTATEPVTASPRPTAPEAACCAACGKALPPSSQHRRTCSDRCRVQLWRRGRVTDSRQLSFDLEAAP
jgi:predicted nucleic acid-binding Zn ribbon protein